MPTDEKKTKTVVAISVGFYGGSLRHPGAEFQVPEGFKGKWFKPKADLKPEDLKPSEPNTKTQPTTLSELSKSKGGSFTDVMKPKK